MRTAAILVCLLAACATTQPVESTVGIDAGTLPTQATGDAGAPLDAGALPPVEIASGDIDEVIEVAPAPPTTSGPTVWAFRVDERTELAQSVIDRWIAATCLDMRITDDGPHQILFTTEGYVAERLGQVTGGWTRATIRVRDVSPGRGVNWINDRVMTVVLAHELGHVLLRSNGHAEGGGVMGYDTLDPKNDIINVKLLKRVCSKNTCPCFNPEAEPRPYSWPVYTPPPATGDAGVAPDDSVLSSDAGVSSDAGAP